MYDRIRGHDATQQVQRQETHLKSSNRSIFFSGSLLPVWDDVRRSLPCNKQTSKKIDCWSTTKITALVSRATEIFIVTMGSRRTRWQNSFILSFL